MVQGREFSPSTIRVEAGETVTFANESAEAHTVTAYQSGIARGAEYFASGGASSEDQGRADVAAGLLEESETYVVTFEVPGRYRYFCIPHEDQGMKGVVTVSS
jgi:plastocyanin